MAQYLVMSRLLMIWMLLTTGFLIYWRMTQPPVPPPASRPSNRVIWLQR